MAETKTNIPIEIKMGNAGTNDTNLPAFKEGSIIFTKDTKKIYIDPVGETERVAVGGGEVDLSGKQDKFADITNPGICKVTMSNSGQTYFCNNASTSGIYFDTSIRLLQGHDITNDDDLVHKKYVDTETAKKQDIFANLEYVWQGNSVRQLSLSLKSASNTTSTGGVVSLIPTLALTNEVGEDIRLTGIAAPTADNDAVNRGYLTTKYGSTYYVSQGKEFYLPSGSNMVIPNTGMGKLFMGSERANSTDFKIYVNDPIDDGKLIITSLKTPTNDEDAANKAYIDTQVATKQAKFAEYTSTRPSEEAPASASTNILVLNEGKDFYLRDRATNPLVEFKIDDSGALEGTVNHSSLTSKKSFQLKSNIFNLSNDKGTPFQVVMDDSKKIVYYGLSGGDDNGSLYLTSTSRTAQQGATLQGNVSSDSRTTALVVNESNTKLLSWKQGTTTNNAPLLGVATPVATADTSKGITADDLDYQAANKKYVDDIKAELLNAINHPYTYDETTKELTLIL